MKIVTQDIRKANVDERDIFIGRVLSQSLITDQDAPSQRVNSITFENGARNRWHTHTTEQVLVVTHGEGIIANAEGEQQIRAGDVVLIPAGERHWHGAAPMHDMTHLAILLPGKMTIEED